MMSRTRRRHQTAQPPPHTAAAALSTINGVGSARPSVRSIHLPYVCMYDVSVRQRWRRPFQRRGYSSYVPSRCGWKYSQVPYDDAEYAFVSENSTTRSRITLSP